MQRSRPESLSSLVLQTIFIPLLILSCTLKSNCNSLRLTARILIMLLPTLVYKSVVLLLYNQSHDPVHVRDNLLFGFHLHLSLASLLSNNIVVAHCAGKSIYYIIAQFTHNSCFIMACIIFHWPGKLGRETRVSSLPGSRISTELRSWRFLFLHQSAVS